MACQGGGRGQIREVAELILSWVGIAMAVSRRVCWRIPKNFPWKTVVEYLVGGWATPLKNMSSSIGMMIIPNINGKIKLMATSHHQPGWLGDWPTLFFGTSERGCLIWVRHLTGIKFFRLCRQYCSATFMNFWSINMGRADVVGI